MSSRRIIDYLPIEPAQIEWRKGIPYSIAFEDYYFNDNGKAETEYIFIEHNNLAKRFATLEPRAHFTIAETGFGTGLNFFTSIEYFLKYAQPSASLFFISIEKLPLTISDIKQALSPWPEIFNSPSLAEFESKYPPSTPGLHTLSLLNGRITLHLFLGDIELGLNQLAFTAHAWFLDGFTPSRNDAMWQENIIKLIADHSDITSTFATFTVVGAVRRLLEAHGFEVNKDIGFGKKREMCFGHYTQEKPDLLPAKDKPWYFFTPRKSIPRKAIQRKQVSSKHENKSCAIIGAGLAGCATAHYLAKAGLEVTVFDTASNIAQETSGNHSGITYTSFSHKPNAQSRYYWQSYLYAIERLYSQGFLPTGVLHLSKDEKDYQHQQGVKSSNYYLNHTNSQQHVHFKDTEAIRSEFHIDNECGGIWMPYATALSPQKLCHNFIAHDNISTQFNTEITQLELAPLDFTQLDLTKPDLTKIEHADEKWQLTDSKGKHYLFDYVIIANAYSAKQFSQTNFINIRTIRGQTTNIPREDMSYNRPYAICKTSYITPEIDGRVSIGASFNLHKQSKDIIIAEHDSNINAAANLLPEHEDELKKIDTAQLDGKAGLRCQTNDYLPIVGPVPDVNAFKEDYSDLAKGMLKKDYPRPQHLPSLYLNTALGSRGITHCFINASIIKAHIFNEPLPIEKDILESLYPARFIIKNIKRRQ